MKIIYKSFLFFSGIIFHYQLSSIHISEDRFHFVSSTAVYICYFHVFIVMNLPREGFICNQHNDQLPVDLLSQLVERCTDILTSKVQAKVCKKCEIRYFVNSQIYCKLRLQYKYRFIMQKKLQKRQMKTSLKTKSRKEEKKKEKEKNGERTGRQGNSEEFLTFIPKSQFSSILLILLIDSIAAVAKYHHPAFTLHIIPF